jgi:hypothetical protein
MDEPQRRYGTRGTWRVCAWCGEEYEGEALDGKFCTRECWQKADAFKIEMEDMRRDMESERMRRGYP